MGIADEIHARLATKFSPSRLEVVDESEKHRGHAGHREGGESHFQVTIAAPAFVAMSRLERHRAVHAALGPDIIARLHALGLSVSG